MPNTPLISVIILTMNAEENIAPVLSLLQKQTIQPYEIIIADSESTDKTVSIAEEYGAKVLPVRRKEFNHGGTRDYAFKHSKGEYVLFLTHDAIPSHDILIEQLFEVLNNNPNMAVVYGRQLPKENATYMERLIREYNYPVESHTYGSKDIPSHGIKTFFMSDVCALYRRNIYEEIGGFEKNVKTNEDMFYAANAIRNGFTVGYAADAKVIHSHNFSLKEQYQRNFIQGYEIECHKHLLCDEDNNTYQNSEGIKLVRFVSRRMLSKGKIFSWIHFGFDCCARYAGNYMGKHKARKESIVEHINIRFNC